MIIMLLGLLFFLFIKESIGLYTYAFGALLFALLRLWAMVQYRRHNQVTRLPQIRLFSAALLVGAAYLMYDGSNSWSVLLLLSAVLEIYVSYRQP